MIIGDKTNFGIGFSVTKVLSTDVKNCLGYFVIFVDAERYGIEFDDQTMLGCSVQTLERIVERRGQHALENSEYWSAFDVAKTYLWSYYDPDESVKTRLGFTKHQFSNTVHTAEIVWAPDGDEAFDDCSFVLILEEKQIVRLVAFVNEGYEPLRLKEIKIDEMKFYSTLTECIIKMKESPLKYCRTSRGRQPAHWCAVRE